MRQLSRYLCCNEFNMFICIQEHTLPPYFSLSLSLLLLDLIQVQNVIVSWLCFCFFDGCELSRGRLCALLQPWDHHFGQTAHKTHTLRD